MSRLPQGAALVRRIRLNLRPTLHSLLRDPRFRLRMEVGLAVALAVGLFLSIVLFSGALTPLEPVLTDLVYQPLKASGQVAVIAIDKKSVDELGPFPWNRTVHADLIERLSTGAPKVIAFDVLFAQSAPEDPGFAAAMRKAQNVVLSAVGVEAAALPQERNSLLRFDVLLLPSAELREAAASVGHRMLFVDPDGILRRAPIAIGTANNRYPALGISAAQAYLGVKDIAYDMAHGRVAIGDRQIQVDESGKLLLNFSAARDGIPSYSYSDVLSGQVAPSTFAGKIVFIGGIGSSEPEAYATPITSSNNTTYNVTIQAGLAEMVIATPPRFLRQQNHLDEIAFTLFFALIAGATFPHVRPIYSAALAIVYVLALLLFAFDAFNRGLVVRVLFPGLAILITFVVIAAFRYLSEERRRQFLTTLFRRYVPAESVGRVVDAVDRGELPLSGARRTVTVLYADLRGFSVLSEGLAPEAVLELVNRYLELMLREIQAENGTINKPMGDALVAIWNAPLDQPDHAPRAARAALNIRRSLVRFLKSGDQERGVNIGLGIATGPGILGNISALGKVEYTLVGETVNIASRISAFAGNNQILADAETAQALPPAIERRELTPVRVRGRKEPLAVWEIRDSGEEISGDDGSDE